MLRPFKGANEERSSLLEPQAPVQAPSFAAWGMEERRGGGQREGRGGNFCTCSLPASPQMHPLSPGLGEVPSRRAQVGGQRRNGHRHLGAHQEESREGRKEGWWEGAREGGRREGGGEREERGRDGGETLKQRTEELGLAKGAGKGWSIEGVRRHLGVG